MLTNRWLKERSWNSRASNCSPWQALVVAKGFLNIPLQGSPYYLLFKIWLLLLQLESNFFSLNKEIKKDWVQFFFHPAWGSERPCAADILSSLQLLHYLSLIRVEIISLQKCVAHLNNMAHINDKWSSSIAYYCYVRNIF